jgi:hypothetical protein
MTRPDSSDRLPGFPCREDREGIMLLVSELTMKITIRAKRFRHGRPDRGRSFFLAT